jgi:hypothetical protein
MKKQEMIAVIISEENQLWKEMQECIDKLGMHNSITDMQIARWATVKNLIEKLQIK